MPTGLVKGLLLLHRGKNRKLTKNPKLPVTHPGPPPWCSTARALSKNIFCMGPNQKKHIVFTTILSLFLLLSRRLNFQPLNLHINTPLSPSKKPITPNAVRFTNRGNFQCANCGIQWVLAALITFCFIKKEQKKKIYIE